MGKVGRPTKFSPEVTERILTAIRAGNSLRASAESANIGYTCFKEWVVRGNEGEEPFATFAAEVQRARGEAEQACVDCIFNAAKSGQWQAAAWLLERSRHEDWGRKDYQRVDMRQSLENLSDEELEKRYLSALKRANDALKPKDAS